MMREAKCPFSNAAAGNRSNAGWWSKQLDFKVLHQHSSKSDPMGQGFDDTKELKSLDLQAVKNDPCALMTDSRDWWPADFGPYGPQFVRMAWPRVGTCRTGDGGGGAGIGKQHFAPLNSWPDNVNLDKARRLIWPVKQKYGRKISSTDLTIPTESLGFKTFARMARDGEETVAQIGDGLTFGKSHGAGNAQLVGPRA